MAHVFTTPQFCRKPSIITKSMDVASRASKFKTDLCSCPVIRSCDLVFSCGLALSSSCVLRCGVDFHQLIAGTVGGAFHFGVLWSFHGQAVPGDGSWRCFWDAWEANAEGFLKLHWECEEPGSEKKKKSSSGFNPYLKNSSQMGNHQLVMSFQFWSDLIFVSPASNITPLPIDSPKPRMESAWDLAWFTNAWPSWNIVVGEFLQRKPSCNVICGVNLKASDAPDISIRDTARTLSETSRFEPFFLLPVHSVKATLHTSHEDSSKSLQSIEAKVSGITAVPTQLGASNKRNKKRWLAASPCSNRSNCQVVALFTHSFCIPSPTSWRGFWRKERKRSNRLYEAMFQKIWD